MDKQLYINIWGEIQKKNAREQAKTALKKALIKSCPVYIKPITYKGIDIK